MSIPEDELQARREKLWSMIQKSAVELQKRLEPLLDPNSDDPAMEAAVEAAGELFDKLETDQDRVYEIPAKDLTSLEQHYTGTPEQFAERIMAEHANPLQIERKPITDYPDINILPPDSGPHLVVIGDLHANLLNAVNPLIAAGILRLSPEEHKEMGEIYYRLYDFTEVNQLAHPATQVGLLSAQVNLTEAQQALLAKAEENKMQRPLTALEERILKTGDQAPKVTPKQILGQVPLTKYQTLRLIAQQITFIKEQTMRLGGGLTPDQHSLRSLNLDPPRELLESEKKLLQRLLPMEPEPGWMNVKQPNDEQLGLIITAKAGIERLREKNLENLRLLTSEEKAILETWVPLPEGSWTDVTRPNESQQELIVKALAAMDRTVKDSAIASFDAVVALALQDFNEYTTSGNLRSDHEKLCQIIDGMEAGDLDQLKDTLVRFIGDLLCDRGVSDFYILNVLKKLKDSGVKFDVLLSNHDSYFIKLILNSQNSLDADALKLIRQDLQTFSEKNNQGNSTTMMLYCLHEGLIDEQEVRALATDVYRPSLKAIAYSLREDGGIDLDDHAGIDLEVIEAMAKRVGVVYQDYDAKHLALTINRINEKVQEHLNNNTLHLLYDEFRDSAGTTSDLYKMPLEDQQYHKRNNPFAWAMWARVSAESKNLGIIDRPATHPLFGYPLGWRQGHDAHTLPEGSHVRNFDTSQGKGRLLAAEPGTVASAVIAGQGEVSTAELTRKMFSDRVRKHWGDVFPGRDISSNDKVLQVLKLLEQEPPDIKSAHKYVKRILHNPVLPAEERRFFRGVAHYLERQSMASQMAIETEASIRFPQLKLLFKRQFAFLDIPPYGVTEKVNEITAEYEKATGKKEQAPVSMGRQEKEKAIGAYKALDKFTKEFEAIEVDYKRAVELVKKTRELPFAPPLTRSEQRFVRNAFKAVENFNQKWVSNYLERMAAQDWGNQPSNPERRQEMLELLRPQGAEGPLEAIKRARETAVGKLAELQSVDPRDEDAIVQWDSFQTFVNSRLVGFRSAVTSQGFSKTNQAFDTFETQTLLALRYNDRNAEATGVGKALNDWANLQYLPASLEGAQYDVKIAVAETWLKIGGYLAEMKTSERERLEPLVDLVWNALIKPSLPSVEGDVAARAAAVVARKAQVKPVDIAALTAAKQYINRELQKDLDPQARVLFEGLQSAVYSALRKADPDFQQKTEQETNFEALEQEISSHHTKANEYLDTFNQRVKQQSSTDEHPFAFSEEFQMSKGLKKVEGASEPAADPVKTPTQVKSLVDGFNAALREVKIRKDLAGTALNSTLLAEAKSAAIAKLDEVQSSLRGKKVLNQVKAKIYGIGASIASKVQPDSVFLKNKAQYANLKVEKMKALQADIDEFKGKPGTQKK